MKEKLEELFDGLKERLKSNFLLTFLVIWLIHHWRFVFMLFNFDSYYYLDSKLSKLDVYLEDEGIYKLWVVPVCWTFFSITVYYLFSAGSELLYIAYSNIRKSVYKRFDNKKIRFASDFEDLEKKYTDLWTRFSALFTENVGLTEQKNTFEKRAIEATNSLNTIILERDTLNIRNKGYETDLLELRKDITQTKLENVELRKEKEEIISENAKQSERKEKTAETQMQLVLDENAKLNRTISELNQKILTIDTTRTERYSTVEEDLFPEDSEWALITSAGESEQQRIFTVKDGDFYFTDGEVKTVSGFQMDKINKSVYFELSSPMTKQLNLDVRLLIQEDGIFLIGIHGENQTVRYRRIGLNINNSVLEGVNLKPHLSTDDLMTLKLLFGESKWKITHLPKGDIEFFTYQNGTFKFTDYISHLSDFSFDNGHLVFSRTMPKYEISKFKTELDARNNDKMEGMERRPRSQSDSKVVYEKLK